MANENSWNTELRRIDEGVYAYIQRLGVFDGPPTSAGISNAGLIAGPESALVIDTLNVPSHTRAFRDAIAEATPAPVRQVVLTHHHADHTHGMDQFPGASFIAHEGCRDYMQKTGQQEITTYAKSRPHWTDELLRVRLVLPDTTMTDRLALYYGDREVQLIHAGPAHTYDDVLVFLPRERILFAGDIAFYRVGPLGHQGDIENWINVIDDVLEMPADVIVPGHGPVGAKEELRDAQVFLRTLWEEGKRLHKAGVEVEAAASKVDLGRFANWPDAQERLQANLTSIYGKLNSS